MIKIAPSVLGADFAKMGDEVRRAEQAGADWLHIDVMDGHFVPNLTMGPDMVSAIRRSSNLFLDVHLMVTNPEKFFEPFQKAGADLLTFHLEVVPDPRKHIKRLRAMGCQVGLSLNPDKSVESVLPYLHLVDLVLLMSVFPGFGGQSFIEESLSRAERIKDFIQKHGLSCLLEMDGGINRDTAPKVIDSGVDILVMGSAFFGDANPSDLVSSLKTIG